MSIVLPGTNLIKGISDDDLVTLGGDLRDRSTQLEMDYRKLKLAMVEWWRWYDAEPRTKNRNFPFKNASNVVFPLIKQQVDAAVAKTFAGLTQTDRYWFVKTEREDLALEAPNVARRINWGAQGNEFDFMLFLYDFITELYIIGGSTGRITWREQIQPIFFGPQGSGQFRNISMIVGPSIDHIPGHLIDWDRRKPIHQSHTVRVQHTFSWDELRSMAQLDPGWRMEAIKEIKGNPDVVFDSSSVEGYHTQAELRTVDFMLDEYLIDEIHIDWPMLGKKFTLSDGAGKDMTDTKSQVVPLVAYVHQKTGVLLRLTAEPYHVVGKPFFSSHYKKRSSRSFGHGMSKHLEQLQSIMTTLYNQAIDSQTRANAVWAITRNPKFLREPLDPSHPILVNSMDEFLPMKLSNSVQPDLALAQAAQIAAERITGQADPALGRESRSGGHPSPATSTLALLQISDSLRSATEKLLTHEISRMGQSLAVLYQQFDTNEDGRLNTIFGDLDAKAMSKFLFPTEPIPGNFTFNVTALDANNNPDVEMRRAITVGQMNTNYWAFVIQGTQVIESPQVGPLVKKTWLQAIDTMTRLYGQFLNAAEVDDMEKFLAKLRETGLDSANAVQQFANGPAQQIAADSGAVPGGGPVGPTNGSVGGGAPAPLAGLGLLQQRGGA